MSTIFNSIDSLEKLSSKLQILIIVFGIFTIIAMLFNFFISKRISKLKNTEEKKVIKRIEITEEKSRPRSISLEQTRLILSYLQDKQKGSIDLISVNGDSESQIFSSNIEQLLISAGWKIKSKGSSIFIKNPFHISLRVHSFETTPEYAFVLKKAFEAADIPLLIFEFKDYPPNSVTFIVGSKLPKDRGIIAG